MSGTSTNHAATAEYEIKKNNNGTYGVILNDNFYSPISETPFPPNMTHLTIGKDYNQNLNDLPITITHLIFGSPD